MDVFTFSRSSKILEYIFSLVCSRMFSAYTKGLKKGDISFINYDNIAKALQISEQTSQNKWTLETPKAKFLPCYQKICHGSEKPCALPHTEQ